MKRIPALPEQAIKIEKEYSMIKKYVTAIVMFIFSAFAWSEFMFLSKAYAQQREQVELTHSSGSVEVYLKESDDFVSVQEGMVLEAGDKIKTGDSSSAELSFNEENSNLVRLEEDTEVSVILSAEEKLEMTIGEVFSTISNLPSGSAFEIRTPTAVSGARGTDWITKVTDEGTDIEAIDSQPYVRHFESDGTLSKERTMITPGEMTTVRKFEKPSPFRPVSQARRQEFQELKQHVAKRGTEAIQKRQERPAFDRKNFLDNIGKQGQPSPQGKFEENKQEGTGFHEETGMQERKTGLDSKTNSMRDKDSMGGSKPLVSLEGQRPSFEQEHESQGEMGASRLEKPLVSTEAGQQRVSQGGDRFPEGRGKMPQGSALGKSDLEKRENIPQGESSRQQNQSHEMNHAGSDRKRDNAPASKGHTSATQQGAGMQEHGSSSNTQGKPPAGKGSAQPGGRGGSRGGAPRGGRPR